MPALPTLSSPPQEQSEVDRPSISPYSSCRGRPNRSGASSSNDDYPKPSAIFTSPNPGPTRNGAAFGPSRANTPNQHTPGFPEPETRSGKATYPSRPYGADDSSPSPHPYLYTEELLVQSRVHQLCPRLQSREKGFRLAEAVEDFPGRRVSGFVVPSRRRVSGGRSRRHGESDTHEGRRHGSMAMGRPSHDELGNTWELTSPPIPPHRPPRAVLTLRTP